MRGVSKSYGSHPAVREVDLTVSRGQVVALLGPNGAGKTTLLSVAAGLLRPDAGTVLVDGFELAGDRLRAQRRLGIAPQTTGLYEPLTVEENLAFFGRLAGLQRRHVVRRVDEVCEALLLGHLRKRQCQQLSGGEKRRVHTAVALIADPPLLVLDEPTVGADIETRAALIELVHELAAGGTGVLYTTHYLPEVEALDADVVLIDLGRVVATGSTDELIATYGSGRLELRFEGEAPSVGADEMSVGKDGDRLWVSTPNPASVAARMLHHFGEDLDRLESVSIVRPSLESVFLNLTGRRLQSEDRGDAA